MNDSEPLIKTEVVGRSARSLPLTAYSLGTGDHVLLFCGPFSKDPFSEKLLKLLFEDLRARFSSGGVFGKADAASLLALRRFCFFPDPNPDCAVPPEGLNGRGVPPAFNFNFSFPPPKPASAPGASFGAFPESEPESRALASFVRRTKPRRALFFERGEGLIFPSSLRDGALFDFCLRACPLETRAAFLPGSPEEWLAFERGVPALRLCASELSPPENAYRLLRPFFETLLTM